DLGADVLSGVDGAVWAHVARGNAANRTMATMGNGTVFMVFAWSKRGKHRTQDGGHGRLVRVPSNHGGAIEQGKMKFIIIIEDASRDVLRRRCHAYTPA